jgi:hypothetical protein
MSDESNEVRGRLSMVEAVAEAQKIEVLREEILELEPESLGRLLGKLQESMGAVGHPAHTEQYQAAESVEETVGRINFGPGGGPLSDLAKEHYANAAAKKGGPAGAIARALEQQGINGVGVAMKPFQMMDDVALRRHVHSPLTEQYRDLTNVLELVLKTKDVTLESVKVPEKCPGTTREGMYLVCGHSVRIVTDLNSYEIEGKYKPYVHEVMLGLATKLRSFLPPVPEDVPRQLIRILGGVQTFFNIAKEKGETYTVELGAYVHVQQQA